MKHQLRQWYYRVCLFLGIYKREDFVTIADVVNNAQINFRTATYVDGLCIYLRIALWRKAKISTGINKVQRYIPKFTRRFVGAPKERWDLDYWWETTNGEESRTVRLEALDKLHYYYICHDELILKGKEL